MWASRGVVSEMVESYFATCRVWAGVAWAVVVLLMAAAWTVVLFDHDHWPEGLMLGFSSCATSAVAGVLHIRSYMVRMCALIRAAHRTDLSERDSEQLGLHPVR
jgi:hypothetical protein